MVKRLIEIQFRETLKRKKSVLLLGPRQTGKTTLVKSIPSDVYLNLAISSERRRFELNPDLIINEVNALKKRSPLIIIDEIQKVPELLDPIQILIDEKRAIFVLTGSSARKLRRQTEINLLPGRLIALHMDPLSQSELPQSLDSHVIFGSLPGIATQKNTKYKNAELRSYVDIYLEEEVRAESIVRNLPAFYRFLELAALESGKIISFNAISQSLGVAHTTVSSYYEILEDCLLAERIDPISESATRKKLTKSSKYLFFDLGVRRLAAQEGVMLGLSRMGELFEQFVGLEILRSLRLKAASKIHFWRDPDGPEVDWVLKTNRTYIPIEVKSNSSPTEKDARHLRTFMQEYPCPHGGFVVCTSPRKMKLGKDVQALPWQDLPRIIELCE